MRSLTTDLIHLLLQWPLWVVLALVLAAWRQRGRRRMAMALVALAAWAVAMPATGNALLAWIEARFPVPSPTQVLAHGQGAPPQVLVLSAGWFRATPQGLVVVMGAPSWERTATAVGLWRQVGGRLLFTGAPLPDGSDSVAQHMAAAARDRGVPAAQIGVEKRSTTTQQNIAYSAREFGLAPGAPVVLMTSALHLPRSLAAARAAGWAVLPYPCDFRADTRVKWQHFLPANEGPGALEELLHEAFGLLLYRMKGWA